MVGQIARDMADLRLGLGCRRNERGLTRHCSSNPAMAIPVSVNRARNEYKSRMPISSRLPSVI